MMILKFNGFIFKLTNTIEKDIEYYPEEERNAFRWYIIQYWHKYICTKRKTTELLHEFSKLNATEKEMILSDAYTALFANKRQNIISTYAKHKEIIA